MRILVVEDDTKLTELLRRGLTEKGHMVDIAADGLKGLEKAQTYIFDAIVLDVMLPGMDGLSIARRLRSAGNRVPILMLTARDSVPDIVKGLDFGADDYLTKPFSFQVLAARLRVIARRASADSEGALQIADLTLDIGKREVWRGKNLVMLTPREFAFLEYLMRRPGRVVSRDDLIHAVWGMESDIERNTVDVFVFQIRTKIEVGGARRLIQTVRGFGYTIRESDE